jgi:RNA polymerase sigma-70 factor (ECF subfamily)
MSSPNHVQTDEQLMLDVRRGVSDAFVELFDRYRDAVWRYFRRRLPDAGRAEELAQDVFVAVLQGTQRYEPRAPFRAYLFGIAFNMWQADRRKTANRPFDTLDADPAAPESIERETAIWVRSALACLDDGDREILMLREYEQLSYEEIAHVQKIPVNTVRSRLYRARMALKAVFDAPDVASSLSRTRRVTRS